MAATQVIGRAEFKRLVILVDEHDKILVRGNGEPSLQEDVRNIFKMVEELVNEKTERKQRAEEEAKYRRRAWMTPLIASAVSAAFGVGGTLLLFYIRFAPLLDRIAEGR